MSKSWDKVICYRCGQPGHYSTSCTNRRRDDTFDIVLKPQAFLTASSGTFKSQLDVPKSKAVLPLLIKDVVKKPIDLTAKDLNRIARILENPKKAYKSHQPVTKNKSKDYYPKYPKESLE